MMKIKKDLVSVIMTNYNTPEDCLREAIESILCQTYSNFEFIIVDDCSTDNSLQVIKSYNDSRIIVLENEENMGLTKSLNKALKIAQGEYIARMDSDDISLPERFEKQVSFLKVHNSTVVCGTWVKLIGEWKEEKYSSDILCRKIPTRDEYRIMLIFGNYPNIAHSSAMFNHFLLREREISYNENYVYAQDYRMWVECSKYWECAILPEVLNHIRVRKNTISTGKREIQKDCAFRIMQEQLRELDLSLDEKTKVFHENFLNKRQLYSEECLEWIKTLIAANKVKKTYNQKKLESIIWKQWAVIIYFGIAGCNIKTKIERISTLPLRYWTELIAIRYKRIREGKL